MEVHLGEVYATLARRYDRAPKEDIEDAVAMAHVATWQAHDSGVPLRNVDAFATCVAKRSLGRIVKNGLRNVHPDSSDGFDWETVSTTNDRLHDKQDPYTELTAQAIVQAAPESYAEVMRLHYLEGYSLEEAAKLIGVSPECFRKRHERALKWARKKFVG